MISYLLQAFIILVPWFTLSVIGSYLASYYSKWRANYHTSVTRHPMKHPTDQAAIMKSMVVEFQEAQCFFMLASEIAVLSALGDQTRFQPKKAAQLDLDNFLAQTIGVGGLVPTGLALFILDRVNMASWYILILSGITLMVSSGMVILSTFIWNNIAPWDDPKEIFDAIAVDSCGGKPPPVVYCDAAWTSPHVTDNQYRVQEALGWMHILPLIVLTACFMRKLLSLHSVSCRLQQWMPQLFHLEDSNIGRKLDRLWTVVILILYLFAMCIYLTSLYYLYGINGIDRAWNLGQIVSVMIWAPVIFKYLYTAVCKCALSHRLTAAPMRNSLG